MQRFVKVFNQNRKHVEVRNQITGAPAEFTLPEVLYKKAILKNFAISAGNACVGVYF